MPVPGKNVNRSLTFFEKYGSIIKDGFTFEPAKPDDKEYEGTSGACPRQKNINFIKVL